MNDVNDLSAAAPSLHILVIDDCPTDIELLQEAFCESSEVIAVHGVPNAFEGFEFLARQGRFSDAPRPDLVMLDLCMPKVTGFDVLGIIKSNHEWAGIPIMVMTASLQPGDRERSIRLGAMEHVTKPSSFDGYLRLTSVLEASMQRRSPRSAG